MHFASNLLPTRSNVPLDFSKANGKTYTARTARRSASAGPKMIMMATGLAHPPSTTLRLLISGNLVAPLKMENWGIHHSSKMERDSPNSSMCRLKCCKMCYEMQPYHCSLMWHVFQERRSTDSFSVSRERGREEDMRPNTIHCQTAELSHLLVVIKIL